MIIAAPRGQGLDDRLIIHWQRPASVEDYPREFGRAGRDGGQALAVLLARPTIAA